MPILGVIASSIYKSSFTPTGSYDALAVYTVPSGGASSITFAGIPQSYQHLQIRGIARTSLAAAGMASFILQFNSDTSTNYIYHRMWGNGTTANAGAGSTNDTSILAGIAPADQNITNAFGASIIDVLDYASLSKNKTIRVLTGADDNNVNTAGYIGIHSGLWFKTPEAITSIKLQPGSGNWNQYTQFALYGIRG